MGYFRFEFFGEGLSSLMKDRKSTKSIELAIKDAGGEVCLAICIPLKSRKLLERVAEGMQFQRQKFLLCFARKTWC